MPEIDWNIRKKNLMSDEIVTDGFFQVGGTLSDTAPSYVPRPADKELLDSILRGEYCNILNARQTGKSSLMIRTGKQLEAQGVNVVIVDLDMIGAHIPEISHERQFGDAGITPGNWYLGLLRLIRKEMKLKAEELEWWKAQYESTPVQRFTRFVKDKILAKTSGQVVIFIDEIDSTLNLPFTDDFFAAIRSMFNERATNPDNKRLTFVLVGVAHPADLIKDRSRTPYNIGRTIELSDFTPQEARTLLPGLEWVYAGQSERILQRVLYWTDGHPYLTQRVCEEIASRTESRWPNREIDRLVTELFLQEGQLRRETNLQRVDDYIQGSEYGEKMLQVYREILSGKKVPDEERSIVKSQLKLSGVIKATSAGYLRVRNRIYERVFGPQWAGMPDASPEERPERTRQLPKLAVPALGAVLLIAIAVIGYNSLIGTPTPALSPTATSTQAVVALEPTDTSTPLPRTPTETATMEVVERTEIPSHTPTPSPTTPSPQATSSPTTTPSPQATSTPTSSPTSTPTATTPPVPTPTSTPSPSPPALLQAPALFEPENGAVFSGQVRLKWTWGRNLEDHERFAIQWLPLDGQPEDDLWVSETEIIASAGAIVPVIGGYRFEANVSLASYPPGEAHWRVAVFGDTPDRKYQISQWSETRIIVNQR